MTLLRDDTRIDLIWIGTATNCPAWSRGAVCVVAPHPSELEKLHRETLMRSPAAYFLFWDERLGNPQPEIISNLCYRPGDIWHAGLLLGTAGLPGLIDFVAPKWMLNRDPDAAHEATSWRISLRACLMRAEVCRQLGGVRPDFETLDAAGLELGHRFITRGALVRHTPQMLSVGARAAITDNRLPMPDISFTDEARFVFYGYGRRWMKWTLWRAASCAYAAPAMVWRAWRESSRWTRPPLNAPYRRQVDKDNVRLKEPRVTALIPTLERYSYLYTLLEQLRTQSVKLHEIIVIDQTHPSRRDAGLAARFPDLPLKVIFQGEPGQCSSRNAGLRLATGDYVLFIDDDDEVPPTLIEQHLRLLHAHEVEVSSGVADEIGAGALPSNFTLTRASDVFPTNNTLIRKSVLYRSGLFDMAYERGQRADGDLGMRVYLSGATMMLFPEISVLHHHAPAGGLRQHKARIITFARSRQSIRTRQLPSVTDIYRARRYFSARQVREGLWQSLIGTFSVRGTRKRKILKAAYAALMLPDTVRQIRKTSQRADDMLRRYPQIDSLPEN